LDDKVNQWLRLYRNEARRRHAAAVADTAQELATAHGVDPIKAHTAGILHDLARDINTEELVQRATQWSIKVGHWEKMNPVVLHAPVGAAMANRELGVQDEEILAAISAHTLGVPGMSLLSKVLYLADVIEPGRSFPGLDDIRVLARKNLNGALLAAMDSSITYLLDRRRVIHPQTLEARNSVLISIQLEEEMF